MLFSAKAATILLTLCSVGGYAWETKAEALAQAVRLIDDPEHFGVSTLSTVYPANHPVTDLAGNAISVPEYFAPCDAEKGSLIYLGVTVSQVWKNVLNSKTKNATVSIVSDPDPSVPDHRHTSQPDSSQWQQQDRPYWRRGMPSKPRVALFGHFDIIDGTQHPDHAEQALNCYLDHHPDASHWAPNATDSPHVSFLAEFSVNKAYWVGGFGDEHYIGWLTSDEWNAAWKEHHLSSQQQPSRRADAHYHQLERLVPQLVFQ